MSHRNESAIEVWGSRPSEDSEALSRIELSHAVGRALMHDRDGWRFIAIAMLIINAIWLVLGILVHQVRDWFSGVAIKWAAGKARRRSISEWIRD